MQESDSGQVPDTEGAAGEHAWSTVRTVGTAGTAAGTAGVLQDEPLLPARVRRPEALIRFVLGLSLIGMALLVTDVARSTAGGLDTDAAEGAGHLPHVLVAAAGAFSTAAVLLVPVLFAAERLMRRDGRRAADGVLAAVLAYGTSLAVDLWVADLAPHAVVAALIHPVGGTGVTEPGSGYLAPVLAYMTAGGVTKRPRWRSALAVALSLNGLAALVSGSASALSIVLALLIGWTVAHGTTYLLGSPNVRHTTEDLLNGLRQVGFTPAAASAVPDTPPREPRRYLVQQTDGRPELDVMVLDREISASGFFRSTWLRLRLHTAPQRRNLLSLRRSLERESLLSYAARAAGVRTRRLLATAELGPDAALVVYEQLTGRTLDQLADAELTDTLLADTWQQLKLLHTRQLAHRTLVPTSLLVDDHGAVHLVNLEGGDIAAGDLALSMDLAQLLTTVALRVGPQRAVASACQVLGPDKAASAVPLLQPIVLSRSTRAALKLQHQRRPAEPASPTPAPPTPDLLSQIREEILRAHPQAPVEAVRLERLRPRTLITVLGSAAAGYVLLLELSSKTTNPLTALAQAQAGWVALAALASAGSYLAATMAMVGFVPERLNTRRAALVQLAGSFVSLFSPSGVGPVAINTRFLQRAGIPPRQAISSVGATQAVGLALHVLLVILFGFLASTRYASPLSASPALVVGLLAAAVLALAATGIPPLRRWIAARLQPLLTGVVPRLLDLLQNPRKLAIGIAGQLLVSLTTLACLYGCTLALGQHPSFAGVAIANLVGGALGSAIPTPGGVGGVETTLPLALEQTTGMSEATAIPAVLLFRLLTFWLPVLPGWLAFVWLQRRKSL